MLCLCIWIAPGLLALPETATECRELPAVAAERIYLAAGYTDRDEKAAIGDPSEQAQIGDPDEQATIGDPAEKSKF